MKATMERALPKSEVFPLGDMNERWGNWRADAACRGQNPKVWLGNRSNAAAPRSLRRVCASCPVAIPCLIEGLNECRVSVRANDTVGTRAGTSAFVRNRIYRLWRTHQLGAFREELVAADWPEHRVDEMMAVLPPPPGKKCPQCETTKPRTEFYKNKRSPDGTAYWCKECTKESNRNG